MSAFAGLAQRLKAHIAYAWVFRDALTAAELIERCGPETPTSTMTCLQTLEDEGLIHQYDGHYFPRGAEPVGWSDEVAARRASAQALLAENRVVLERFARLPWIRMLAVSGSLAQRNPRGVPGTSPDVDLFIITEPGAVHIVRMIVRGVSMLRRARGLVSGGPAHARLCPSYVTEADFLEVAYQSLFTASDAMRVIVLKGAPEYRRFLAENRWIGRFYALPLEADVPVAPIDRPRLLRRLANLACFSIMRLIHRFKQASVVYSVRYRPYATHTWRRVAATGGGYQPQIASRFAKVYGAHFGPDDALTRVLFPGTTDRGVVVDGVHHPTSTHRPLAFDE